MYFYNTIALAILAILHVTIMSAGKPCLFITNVMYERFRVYSWQTSLKLLYLQMHARKDVGLSEIKIPYTEVTKRGAVNSRAQTVIINLFLHRGVFNTGSG